MIPRTREHGVTLYAMIVAAVVVVGGMAYFSFFAPADASVSSDDGAYVLAARAVEEGRWYVPYAADDVVGAEVVEPYGGGSQGDSRSYPYTKRPLWVMVVAVADGVGGVIGMRLLLLGAVGCGIVATAALGGMIHSRRVGCLSAVAMALSPYVLNGLQLWAHAATVPLMAFAYMTAARGLAQTVRLRSVVGVVVSVAAAVALHQSSIPFAAALCVVLFGHGLFGRNVSAVIVAGSVGAGAVAGQVGSSLSRAILVDQPLGVRSAIQPAVSQPGVTTWGRVEGFLDVFATNISGHGSTEATVLGLMAVLLVLCSAVAWRRSLAFTSVVLMAVAVAFWVVRIAIDGDAFATGLFVAWPVVCLIAVRPPRAWAPAEQMLVQAVLLAFPIVALRLTEVGGGLNWGGRYLSPAVPVLAVLLAGSADALLRSHRSGALPILAGALAILVMVQAVQSDLTTRERHDQDAELATQARTEVVITSDAHLPRRSWRTVNEVDWLVVAPDDSGGVVRTEEILRSAGIRQFTGYQLSAEHYEQWTGRPASTQPEDGVVITLGP